LSTMMMLDVQHVAKRYREDELSQMADTTYRRLWMHVYRWTMHRNTRMTGLAGPQLLAVYSYMCK
jgi:hypothetical protein